MTFDEGRVGKCEGGRGRRGHGAAVGRKFTGGKGGEETPL